MKKLNINIDGRKFEAYAGQTILAAARDHGIFIPTLCEDGRTEIYGACGICVVEAEGVPKLLKACATELVDGMIIHTDTQRVVESRKTMLELLLSDHTGDCRPPCVHGCPAQTDCQGYVGLAANGQAEEAYKLIMDKIPLPASIGRVCPHPCEEECRRGLVDEPVGIAGIKRSCGDYALTEDHDGAWMPEVPSETGKSVAIIGGGPYGLSLAYFLRQYGHDVTIFEAMPKIGGMLRYGIPEYRLPKAILDSEVGRLEKMGIEIRTSHRVGRDIPFESLRDQYDAVCIGVGAWLSTGTGAKGEDLPGVIGGIELLGKVAKGEDVYLGKRVAVVGGGNTAMDACRTAVRMGATEVYSVYRRTKSEMPAEQIEIREAEEEGVIFKTLTNPLEIIPGNDGYVSQVKLQIMELGDPDASGRRAPVPVKGKTEMLAVDAVVLAVGQAADAVSIGAKGLELTRKNSIIYDPQTFATSLPGVFAGGDCGNDKVSIAVEAIADAGHSAGIIHAYLYGEEIVCKSDYAVRRDDVTERTFEGRERLFRPPVGLLPPDERKQGFAEVADGWNTDEVMQEGMRCLECGCGDYFECKLIEYARLYDVKPERFSGEVSAAKDGVLPAPDADKDGHPFIEREEGKCILCGLCVRICGEVASVSALGFVGRGFETIVDPAFDVPLNASGCLSCGLCVDACPTGALRERLSLNKSVPLETVSTETTCPYCGLGCGIALESYGDLLVKANPQRMDGRDGLICGRGKFGFDCAGKDDGQSGESGVRLKTPLIRSKETGTLLEAAWYETFGDVVKKAQGVQACYGPGSVAVSISDRLTNEEVYAARSLAYALGARVFSFNNRVSVASEFYGSPVSSDYVELLHTDYILLVGFNFALNPVLAMRLSRAAATGVKIVRIETGKEEEAAGFGAHLDAEWIHTPNNLKLLSGIEAALREEKAPAGVAKMAHELQGAKKAMIVYQRNTLTPEAAAILCRIALLSGHEGASRNGLFEVMPQCNSGGLYDLEITATPADILNSGYGADVKAIFVLGEDPVSQIAAAEASDNVPEELKAAKKLLAQASFLAVCDTHLTETARIADVIFPMSGFAASDGTFVNTEGRLLAVNPAVKSGLPYANWEIFREIAAIAGTKSTWKNESDISCEINEAVPAYRHKVIGEMLAGVDDVTAKGSRYWIKFEPVSQSSGKLISPLPTSDHLTRSINRRLDSDIYGI